MKPLGELGSGTAKVRPLSCGFNGVLPNSELFALRSHDDGIGFRTPEDFAWSDVRLKEVLPEAFFASKSRVPDLGCELPKMDEGGGTPAGVKELVEDGGGPAGVVEGCGNRLLVPRFRPPREDRRESGVEGGLDDKGTANVPDILRDRLPVVHVLGEGKRTTELSATDMSWQ